MDFRMSKKKEKTVEKKAESKGKKAPKRPWFAITKWGIGCVFLALVSGIANKKHVEYLFESDKHFSHLSTMERDMAFRHRVINYIFVTMLQSNVTI